jgi:hypothetical protein
VDYVTTLVNGHSVMYGITIYTVLNSNNKNSGSNGNDDNHGRNGDYSNDGHNDFIISYGVGACIGINGSTVINVKLGDKIINADSRSLWWGGRLSRGIETE